MSGRIPELLIATDLDGCLIDETSYAFNAARSALAALHARRVPLILASSKTRSEMEALAGALGPVAALIIENGGAIVMPDGSPLPPVRGAHRDESGWSLELGVERARLVVALDEIATTLGIRIRGFSALTVHEIAGLTGLPPAGAALASARNYDEPFLLDEELAAPSVAVAAESRGLRVTRGGRFHHLTGDTDKGRALRVLLAACHGSGEEFITVGLGDSANDRSLLEAVDQPIVIPRPDGAPDPVLAAVPGAWLAPAPGPSGWNAAVNKILAGESLPPAAAGNT